MIDSRYGAFFQKLTLSPEQTDRLASLLAERQTTRQEVLVVARDQGVDHRTNPEAFRKLVNDVQKGLNAGIKAIIGDSAYAQLETYEQSLP